MTAYEQRVSSTTINDSDKSVKSIFSKINYVNPMRETIDWVNTARCRSRNMLKT